MSDDQDWDGEGDWYNDPEAFPDMTETRAMTMAGRITGDEWVSVGSAMPELGDYHSPEEALRQRYAFDVAIRAVAIDREWRAEALGTELDNIWQEVKQRLVSQVVAPDVSELKLDPELLATQAAARSALVMRARSFIAKQEIAQGVRGTGDRRLRVLELTLQCMSQREIAEKIGRAGDVDTVKNDRRWLKEHGLLP